jgi:O-antigen chain-terminating methyltransferase
MSEIGAPHDPLSPACELGLGPGMLLAQQRCEGGVTSSESRFGWLGAQLKRAVRRLLRFHLLRQAEFNAGAVRALREAEVQLRALAGALARVEARGEAQEEAASRQAAESLARLEARQIELEARLAGLDPGAAPQAALEERLRGLEHALGELEAELAERGKRLEARAEEWRAALERQAAALEAAEERERGLALGLAELREASAGAARAERIEAAGRALRGELEQRLAEIRSELAQRLEEERRRGAELERRLEEERAALEARAAELGATLGRVEGEHGAQLERSEAALRACEPRLESAERDLRALAESLTALAGELRGRLGSLAERVDPRLPLDYLAFEQEFRGEEAAIRERMRKYVELFRPGQRVLDVGCGRGEFLEVSRELGVDACGVDADADMVSCCTVKRLEVVQDCALHHLEGLRDRSLDGLFSAQFVEHLAPADLLRFLSLAAAKLRRGGLLVLETINPDTFTALRTFYLDPTHRHPLPSRTLRFLVEAAGFRVQQVLHASPVPDEAKLALLPEGGAARGASRAERDRLRLARALNANLCRLNECLFGPQDYAVVARR